jgi:hypothetical protein
VYEQQLATGLYFISFKQADIPYSFGFIIRWYSASLSTVFGSE